MKKPKGKMKVVKAWGIFRSGRLIPELIVSEKKILLDNIERPDLDKVIPCQITYEVPQ